MAPFASTEDFGRLPATPEHIVRQGPSGSKYKAMHPHAGQVIVQFGWPGALHVLSPRDGVLQDQNPKANPTQIIFLMIFSSCETR